MELTYKVRGADGKEYGPASLAQLTGWLREGRVSAQSEVRRSDTDYWALVADFAELKSALPATTAPAPLSAAGMGSVANDTGLDAEVRAGASWFYWVAGLSVVNTLFAVFEANIQLLFGLGITQVADAFGRQLEGGGKFIALVVSLGAAGVLALFGVFGNKRQTWAFAVGLPLYALDAVILLLFKDWIGVAFHAYVIYRLVRGFMACRTLNNA